MKAQKIKRLPLKRFKQKNTTSIENIDNSSMIASLKNQGPHESIETRPIIELHRLLRIKPLKSLRYDEEHEKSRTKDAGVLSDAVFGHSTVTCEEIVKSDADWLRMSW